ncbi:MAG: sulfate ABC transporter permease subunit CysT [Xanthomonadales bacterium]|nr:Sulfate transport system permease protein CysT [Xanthomonadales bacterium]MCC6593900.1 sulfate ABC transporter permease subunit CysT [Xanthomonadales bacterium]MCE7932743.1 sulfate ABC transporter permease subunit CysT [Xanthomonadales bacterium PRO6]
MSTAVAIADPPVPAPAVRWRDPLPGFGLTLGWTLTWLGLIVLLPLAALVVRASDLGGDGWAAILASQRVQRALWLSFGSALLAATVATVVGALVAWVLVRYRFPGRRLLDAMVDLPFALPTAVAGIALTALYSGQGWIGRHLEPLGIQVAQAPLGIVLALVFIGLPFTVRTVQPLLETTTRELEEAAATLGASRPTILRRVVLPPLLPALLTGFSLAFARGVGEYGSVIFIAGNIPFVSEIAPLLIVIKLEEFDYAGATGVAVLMLAISFVLLLAISGLQKWVGK